MALVAKVQLRQHRISHLQELIDELAQCSKPNRRLSRGEFAELFREAQSILEVTDDDLAEYIRVSRPTIGRWASGETAPHPIGMPGIFKAMADLGKRKLKTYGATATWQTNSASLPS